MSDQRNTVQIHYLATWRTLNKTGQNCCMTAGCLRPPSIMERKAKLVFSDRHILKLMLERIKQENTQSQRILSLLLEWQVPQTMSICIECRKAAGLSRKWALTEMLKNWDAIKKGSQVLQQKQHSVKYLKQRKILQRQWEAFKITPHSPGEMPRKQRNINSSLLQLQMRFLQGLTKNF